MAQFKAGDVVRLKSGGPKMTVRRAETDGEVVCEWFSEKKAVETAVFNETSLEIANTGISMTVV
jgi:uncharacterized protein YodC (DUF2158 family)